MNNFEVIRLPRNSSFAICLDISPDGCLLATGGRQEAPGLSWMNIGVRLWDPVALEEVASLHGFDTYSIRFSPDSRYLACSNGDHVYLWGINGEEDFTLEGTSRVNGIAFSPDGLRLAAACADGTIRMWNMDTRDSIVFEVHNPRISASGGSGAFTAAFSPDGQLLATGGCDDTVRFWESKTGKSKGWEIIMSDRTYPNPVYDIAFSPDGALLAICAERRVELWDLAAGTQFCRLTDQFGHGGYPVAFSPDGQLIATPKKDSPAYIKLWQTEDVRRCNLEGEIRLSADDLPDISGLVFGRDSQALFTAHGYEIRRWSLEKHVAFAGTAREVRAGRIFCGGCGAENSRADNFCSRCGQPLSNKIGSAAAFEYRDFVWAYPTDRKQDCVPARTALASSDASITLRQHTEVEARIHFWQKYQRVILSELQKWQDANWQPVTEVGASCIELASSSSQESSRLLHLAKALFLEQWCLVGARIKVRRQVPRG